MCDALRRLVFIKHLCKFCPRLTHLFRNKYIQNFQTLFPTFSKARTIFCQRKYESNVVFDKLSVVVGVSSWHGQYVEIFIGQYPKESWSTQGNYSHIKPLFLILDLIVIECGNYFHTTNLKLTLEMCDHTID